MINYDLSRVAFRNIAVHKESGWFCNLYYNALFKIDLRTKEISLERLLPYYGQGFKQYGPIAYCQGRLVLAPLNADKILIYNLQTKNLEEIQLNTKEYVSGRCFNLFFNIETDGENVYLFPGRFHAIVKVNIYTKDVFYYADWYKELKNFIVDFNKILFFRCNARLGTDCYLPFWQNNFVMRFNLRTGRYKIISLYEKKASFSGILIDNTYWWISLKEERAIIRYNQFTREIKRFALEIPDGYVYTGTTSMSKNGETIFLFPIWGTGIFELDTTTEACTVYKDIYCEPLKEVKDYVFEETNMLCIEGVGDNLLILYSNFDGDIIFMNTLNREWECYPAKISRESDIKLINKKLLFTKRWKSIQGSKEGIGITLTGYLSKIKEYNHSVILQYNGNKCGKEIYKNVVVK